MHEAFNYEDMLYKISVTRNNNKFKIEERQRQIASMLAQSMTQRQIAAQLNISQARAPRYRLVKGKVTKFCL